MSRLIFWLIVLLSFIGVIGYQKHLLNQNKLYIKAQEEKIEKLRKKLLTQKSQSQVECFEKEIYSRKRFLEEDRDEKNSSFDESSNTIIF